MADNMKGLKRTHYCAQINKAGQTVVVGGFVQKIRDKGKLVFIDLRDRSGVVQLTFDDRTESSILEKAQSCRSEFVLMAKGTVIEREAPNPDMITGNFEILVDDLRILAKSQTPPFEIVNDTKVNEELRLKYRYLDLRRSALQQNLITRHNLARAAREYFFDNDFIEISSQGNHDQKENLR